MVEMRRLFNKRGSIKSYKDFMLYVTCGFTTLRFFFLSHQYHLYSSQQWGHKVIKVFNQHSLFCTITLAWPQLFCPILFQSSFLPIFFQFSVAFPLQIVHPNALRQLLTPSLLSPCLDQFHCDHCNWQPGSFISAVVTTLFFFYPLLHLILDINLRYWLTQHDLHNAYYSCFHSQVKTSCLPIVTIINCVQAFIEGSCVVMSVVSLPEPVSPSLILQVS